MKNVLILVPRKVLNSIEIDQWKFIVRSNRVTLFTGSLDDQDLLLNKELESIFDVVRYFKNYAENDFVEIAALELHHKTPLDQIIALSEADLSRAARIRLKLGVPGPLPTEVEPFRNKLVMKTIAKGAGIPVAEFSRVSNSFDVIEFKSRFGYPFIIKPIAGRGSASTWKISSDSDLQSLLTQGLFSSLSDESSYICEQFQSGTMYHVDGLILDHLIHTISAAKYVNNCLDFVSGSFLGSYTLPQGSPLTDRLIVQTEKLLQYVYQPPKNTLFHVEYFVTEDSQIVLCEIAMRQGGNGINNEILISQGINVLVSYLDAELNGTIPQFTPNRTHLAGRLLIPPKCGILKKAPTQKVHDHVLKYFCRGKMGETYSQMKMSNDELANFLFIGHSESEMEQRIQELYQWFETNTDWTHS